MPYNAGFFSPTSIPREIECKTNLGDAFQAKRGGLDEAKAGQGCDRRQEVPLLISSERRKLGYETICSFTNRD